MSVYEPPPALPEPRGWTSEHTYTPDPRHWFVNNGVATYCRSDHHHRRILDWNEDHVRIVLLKVKPKRSDYDIGYQDGEGSMDADWSFALHEIAGVSHDFPSVFAQRLHDLIEAGNNMASGPASSSVAAEQWHDALTLIKGEDHVRAPSDSAPR